jgi:(2R)-sulfolactate sulfo-lyase subunit beta
MTVISQDTTFLGYRRENGRVGVRNHVIVLPLDDLSNAAAEAVAHNIKGTLAIPHPYGRLQFGADLELHFRTLIGAGSNPNVAAVVVIGIEDSWTQKVVEGIKATGKPVVGFGIEGHGDHDTIMRASKAAREYLQWASEKHREPCPIHELWVSTKCGESDTTSGCGANPTVGDAFDKLHSLGSTLCFGETTELTGGEHIVAARCASDAVRERFMFMFNRYQEVINRHKTTDLSDSQPTKGNIAGGLTTIEEKALGNIQKIGKKCTIDGVLDKAEMPDPPRLVVHGFQQRRGRDGDLVRGLGLRGALLPHGPGQRHRQPDPAGHQGVRQPAHGAPDERARGRRHVGPAAA